MISSMTLKNSFSLFKFYINDTLKGILNRPFFQKKRNIITFSILILIMYLWYFYLNMRAMFKLGNVNAFPKLETLTKITITSYVDMFIILAICLGVFVNSTLNFNHTSLFITNLLPFTQKEVSLGQKLFKLFFALVFFELNLLLVFPFFGRIALISSVYFFLLLLEFHFIFIAIFLMVDIIYATLAHALTRTTNKIYQLVFFVVDFLLLIIAGMHFFIYRFPLERFLGQAKISVIELVNIIGVLSLGLLFLIIFLILKFNFYAPIFVTQSYLLTGISGLTLNILPTFRAILRQKNILYSLTLVLLAFVITLVQSGLQLALESLSNLYIVFMFSGIGYASSTQKIRKFYSFYRISILQEFKSLIFTGLVFISPLLLLTLWLEKTGYNLLICYVFFLISLIAGFLFPKNQGSFNEALALTLSSVIGILGYQVLQHKNLTIPTILILLLLLLFIIRRERLENE